MGDPVLAQHADLGPPASDPLEVPVGASALAASGAEVPVDASGLPELLLVQPPESAPQPRPGYVQLCWVSMGWDGMLSIVRSCTVCGRRGWAAPS